MTFPHKIKYSTC